MSMSWHAGGSDFLIRHIKRQGQTEQTGKERQTRWGPSNCLRYTVGVCVSGWSCEKVCSMSFACLSLDCAGLYLTTFGNVSAFVILCEHVSGVLQFSVVECNKLPSLYPKNPQKSVKVMKALGQRRRLLHVSGGSFVSFFTAFKLKKENFSTPSLHSVSQCCCWRICCKDNQFPNVSSQEKTYVCPCSSNSYH